MSDLLSINWDVAPTFSFLGITLRWYSLLFVSGFIIGLYVFKRFFERENINLKLIDSLFVTLMLATIVGARLGHCIFYEPEDYFGSWEGFLEIFKVWKGGLASHGGTIALFIAMFWYSRKYGPRNGFDFVWLLDHLCIPVSFAAMAIRIGNLFNSEIYGGPTSLPWGFVFLRDGQTQPMHPTQLYEAMSYCLLGIVLVWLYRNKLEKIYRGTLIGIFFIGCFGSRFLIEFVKNNQVDFEEGMLLNMGQLLSIPFILLGAGFLFYAFRYRRPAYSDNYKKNGTKIDAKGHSAK